MQTPKTPKTPKTNGAQNMSNKQSQRRRLVRSLAAGGGALSATALLPNSWTKPVVNTVILPAHAQLSGLPQSMTFAFANLAPSASGAVFACSAAGPEMNGATITLAQPVTPGTAVDFSIALLEGDATPIGNPLGTGTVNGTGLAATVSNNGTALTTAEVNVCGGFFAASDQNDIARITFTLQDGSGTTLVQDFPIAST